jgi:putative transposase
MANTYTQLYVHLVFAVKGRQNFISKDKKDELQKFITGVVTNRKHKLLAIENEPDHIHILLSIRPDVALSDLTRDIKANSSRWINERFPNGLKFSWQDGYGAFSVSRSQLSTVIAYIHNQEEHHRTKSFKEEFLGLLKRHEIEFDERYLFEWYE